MATNLLASEKPRVPATSTVDESGLWCPHFSGITTFMKYPYSKDISGNLDMIIAGIPLDTLCTARPGTRLGPTAIRSAYRSNTYNPDLKVDTAQVIHAVDWGDIPVYNGNTMETFDSIRQHIETFASTGAIPLTLGGDHSMAFPELMGYKKVYDKLAIVHFDSHSDTGYGPTSEEAPFNHGTPFLDAITRDCVDTVHSIQIGMRGLLPSAENHKFAADSGMSMIDAFKAHQMGVDNVAAAIREKVADAPVFVTFDIDFLDPAYAPGTGTPEGGGFTTWEAFELIRKSLLGLNIKGFDLVCVNPTYDIGEVTGMAASHVAFEFMSLIAAKKAGITEYKGFKADF